MKKLLLFVLFSAMLLAQPRARTNQIPVNGVGVPNNNTCNVATLYGNLYFDTTTAGDLYICGSSGWSKTTGSSVSLTGGTGISVSPNPITGTGVITNTAPGASPAGPDKSVQYDNAGSFGAFGQWDGTLFSVAGSLSTTENLAQPQFQSGGSLWQTNGVGHFVITTGSATYTGAGGSLICYVFSQGALIGQGNVPLDLSVGTHALSFIYSGGGVFDVRCNTINGSDPDELLQSVGDMTVPLAAGGYYKFTYTVSASGASTVTFPSYSIKRDSRFGINSTGGAQFTTLNGMTPLVYDSYGVVQVPLAGTNQNSFILGPIGGDGYDPNNISHVVTVGLVTESAESNGLTAVGYDLTSGAHLCTMMGYQASCTGDQAFAFGRASVSKPGNIAFGDQASDAGFSDVLIFSNFIATAPVATADHQVLFGSRTSTDMYWGAPGGSNVVTFHQGGHAGITCTTATTATIKRIEGGIITDATCP